MPKKDSTTGEPIISETGNWNVASDFARVKIMNPQSKCEYYEDIATFGYDTIIEELMNYSIPNDLVKFTGLKRLVRELIKLCKNTRFAMKRENTKGELDDYEKALKQIKTILPSLINIKRDHVNKTEELVIISEKYNKVLEIVLEIKASINIPLNKNHLIFTDREEFDPNVYKKLMKIRMQERG